MAYLIIVVLLIGVVWLVSAPLRRGADTTDAAYAAERDSIRRIDLEAARDAKYREIRDADLDHQTGKLSDDDYAAIDSTLRAEAVDLLHRLDELDQLDESNDSDQFDESDDSDQFYESDDSDQLDESAGRH